MKILELTIIKIKELFKRLSSRMEMTEEIDIKLEDT